MGDHQAGKTTLINLLMSALNKAALNEYMLAVQDLRKAKMM
jgi:ABC-type multidrug transport system ATPase subunit